MKPSVFPVLALLALVAFAACGESSSSGDDDGAAGGAGCATDEDCAGQVPKCSQAGECVPEGWCETDADCRGDLGFCNTFTRICGSCRTDADCPSETPACVPAWEYYELYCAACRGGDSSTCPAGTWCASVLIQGGGGRCEASNCDADPEGTLCLACINGSVGPCLDDGGECSAVLTTLRACYVAEIPGWMISDCSTGVVPSLRDCTPEACFDEAEAMDACLLGCDAVNTVCGL